MSQENLEFVHRQIEAVNGADLEAILADMDPEIVFIARRSAVQGAYHGHDGVRAWFADTQESFDVFEVTSEEIHGLGDRAVVLGSLRVRGRESGAEAVMPLGVVATFREGKMVRFEDFGEHGKALEAGGLAD